MGETMPLIALSKSDPETVNSFSVKQVVSFAGDGSLKDGSTCSAEFREYLSGISSEKIRAYVEHCLSESFEKSGLVLQDLVNELGRRLDFTVEDGFYSGRKNQIGNDGLWLAPEGNHIVLEVKTTDAYRMSMDTIAGYREKLIQSQRISENSSILVVVGREDTGELEAQVRGSRHAWDIRLISAEALAKMIVLKENSDEEETGRKIRQILAPVEYTRVDALVDVVFTAATDVESDFEEIAPPKETIVEKEIARINEITQVELLNEKRSKIVAAMSEKLGETLIKRTRAMYWSASRSSRIACTISKRYEDGPGYWYAFHPKWQSFLSEADRSACVLGCMGRDDSFALPLDFLENYLDLMNTTGEGDKMYWHLHLNEGPDGDIYLVIPRQENVSVMQFQLKDA